jgi:crotonobetainyl-CoA:carnitine CoA-transferase CaiB-like acyl-CoA transferase
MTKVMEGVRVVEVSIWGFVPAAGAVLADWGADVIKVEHPVQGDPMRGLRIPTLEPEKIGVTFMWEIVNRGKRDIGIDIGTHEGREVLLELVDTADVFLTNFLPAARRKLGIDVDDIMARNPRIVYARGSGQGPKGPDAEKGGFDAISYWFRPGVAAGVTPREAEWPVRMPGPAFGDVQTGMMLAGGVGAALAYRERTGKGTVVDASLLAAGMWAMQPGVVATQLTGEPDLPKRGRTDPNNPLANIYRTSDGRFIALNMLQADRYWPGLCHVFERDDLVTDPRFATHEARVASGDATIVLLDEIFDAKTLDEWRDILGRQEGQWDVVQTVRDVNDDVQAIKNGYLRPVEYPNGVKLSLVSAPVQFDETAPDLQPAPELGAHTEELLLELGHDWDDIVRLKSLGAVN